jgi:hypothetical protein
VSKRVQLRGRLTGGEGDVVKAYELFRQSLADAGMEWTEELIQVQPFGQHGPLHKLNFGLAREVA